VNRSLKRCRNSAHRAVTLIECLLAMAVLSTALLGISYVAVAGEGHLKQSERTARAIRLAEHLMEEIASKPYAGSGVGRANWHQADYNNFVEMPGTLRDFAGELYTDSDQQFSRFVLISDTSTAVPQLNGIVLSGRNVTIQIEHTQGNLWRITRFIPQPAPATP